MEIVKNTTLEHDVALMDTSPEESLIKWRGPLFVIGMWRSGTSLLYALLNKHPEIALLYEGDLLMLRPLFWIPGAGKWKVRRWEFWNKGLQRHNLDSDSFFASNVRGMATEAYRQYALHKGSLIGGEKSPNYFDSIPELAKEFPNARFIVIWRNPAAICSSVIRAGNLVRSWFNRKGMCLRVLLGMEVMRAQCDRLVRSGGRIHELSYEGMVSNPIETMKEICRFLEISFVPEMASLEGADRSAIYEGAHHTLVKGKRIVSSAPRPEVVPAELKTKIARYLAFWTDEYGDKWPQISSLPGDKDSKASLVERISDRVRFRFLRLLDSVIILIYCFAPLALLRCFRAIKHKKEEARAKQVKASTQSSDPDKAVISHTK
jgi:Sulfotransferase family